MNIAVLEARKSFRTAKIPNYKESRNRNFFLAKITTFSLPNQTVASLTLNSAKPKSLFDRTKLWHKSLQNVFSDIVLCVVPNTNYEIRSKALALKKCVYV